MASIIITNNTGSNIVLGDLGNLVLIPGANDLSGVLERESLVESVQFANELEVTGDLDLVIDGKEIAQVIDIFSNLRDEFIAIETDLASGTLAQAAGNNAVAIGSGTSSTGVNSVSLGHNALAGANGTIAIGGGTSPGSGADATSATAIAIGSNSTASGTDAITIGRFSSATMTGSVALGASANSTADDAIQLGAGTNNMANTLQLGNQTIASSDGILIPSTSGVPTSTPLTGTPAYDGTANVFYLYDGSAWQTQGGNGIYGGSGSLVTGATTVTGTAGDSLNVFINSQTAIQQTDIVLQLTTAIGGNGGVFNLSAGGATFSFLGTGDLKFNSTAGTAGQALVTNGSGSTPTWQTVVDDQGSSQYIQFANSLIQWGATVTNTGAAQTVTLPTAFANTSYAVTVTYLGSNTEAITATIMGQTTTQFVLTHRSNDDTTSAVATNDFHYIAIGLAP